MKGNRNPVFALAVAMVFGVVFASGSAKASSMDLQKIKWIRADAVRAAFSLGGAHRATLANVEGSVIPGLPRLGVGTTFLVATWDDFNPHESNVMSYDIFPIELTFLLWGNDSNAERWIDAPEYNQVRKPPRGMKWIKRTDDAQIIAPLVYLRYEATFWGQRMDGPHHIMDNGRDSRRSRRMDVSLNYASNIAEMDWTWEISIGALLLNSPSRWELAEINESAPYLRISFGWFGSWMYARR